MHLEEALLHICFVLHRTGQCSVTGRVELQQQRSPAVRGKRCMNITRWSEYKQGKISELSARLNLSESGFKPVTMMEKALSCSPAALGCKRSDEHAEGSGWGSCLSQQEIQDMDKTHDSLLPLYWPPNDACCCFNARHVFDYFLLLLPLTTSLLVCVAHLAGV